MTTATTAPPALEVTGRRGHCPESMDGRHCITWGAVPKAAPVPEAGRVRGVCYDCSAVFTR